MTTEAVGQVPRPWSKNEKGYDILPASMNLRRIREDSFIALLLAEPQSIYQSYTSRLCKESKDISLQSVCYLKATKATIKMKSTDASSMIGPASIIHIESHLGLLDILLIHGSSADAIGTLSLLKTQMLIHVSILRLSTMIFFLEDGIGLDGLEFGLEIADGVAVGAAIGATTGVGEVVAIVLGLVSRSAPVMV